MRLKAAKRRAKSKGTKKIVKRGRPTGDAAAAAA